MISDLVGFVASSTYLYVISGFTTSIKSPWSSVSAFSFFSIVIALPLESVAVPPVIDVASLALFDVSTPIPASTSTLTVPLQSLYPFEFLVFSKPVNSNVYLYPTVLLVPLIVAFNASTFT